MEETGDPFHGFLGDSHDVLAPILAAEEAKWPEEAENNAHDKHGRKGDDCEAPRTYRKPRSITCT